MPLFFDPASTPDLLIYSAILFHMVASVIIFVFFLTSSSSCSISGYLSGVALTLGSYI